jgi:hypothetical protein
MEMVEVREVLELRTTAAATATPAATDDDCPSGAAAAFALLATVGASFGAVAGALLF